MIFKFGESPYARAARLNGWHLFFAIWPRRVDVVGGRSVMAWLEWIERREARTLSFDFVTWEYRARTKPVREDFGE